MQRFTELKVWQRSFELTVSIYRRSESLPVAERFGLVAQIRRAMVSVPSNIAEGAKRASSNEYAHYLNIAEGSLAETESLLRLWVALYAAQSPDLRAFIAECDEISRMLYALWRKIQPHGR